MMKKIVLSVLTGLSICFTTSAQLKHSAGFAISVLHGKVEDAYGWSSTLDLMQTSLSYFPRYNVIQGGNMSLSVGAPVALGAGITSNTQEDDTGLYFAYELPVVVDFNLGCNSSTESDSHFGGYVGTGFSYYRINISKSTYSNFNGESYGPVVRAGIRFGNWGSATSGVTIGLSYKFGMEARKFRTYGIQVYYDF